MKMDAVHGYFQLALAEESSFLTTFLLKQGKFRYLRAPMGLNASSDKWCCHSDRMITGLPWAKKMVDDTIIWATTLGELRERANVDLQRCRDLNITISLKKLKMGKERGRRLKQFSQPSEANQTIYFIQTNRVLIMLSAHSSSARTLKVKFHKLPP